MAKKYNITARCDSTRCATEQFQRIRRKMTYMSTDGHEHVIERLVCPDCGLLGHVERIDQIQGVA